VKLAALVLFSFVACSSAPPTKPPRPSPASKDTLEARDGADCAEPGSARFFDRNGLWSFCAPQASAIGWHAATGEFGTIETAIFAPDRSCNFSVIRQAPAPKEGIGPGAPPPGGKIDFDDPAKLAGRAGRHFGMKWHDHRNRSFALDEHGNHFHDEEEDHDVVMERWAILLDDGAALSITVRTQEDTPDERKKLLTRIRETFRFESK
jgi:hypothetical protein